MMSCPIIGMSGERYVQPDGRGLHAVLLERMGIFIRPGFRSKRLITATAGPPRRRLARGPHQCPRRIAFFSVLDGWDRQAFRLDHGSDGFAVAHALVGADAQWPG